eukprot:12912028-Alexandrium_andersonii.AAC.1
MLSSQILGKLGPWDVDTWPSTMHALFPVALRAARAERTPALGSLASVSGGVGSAERARASLFLGARNL